MLPFTTNMAKIRKTTVRAEKNRVRQTREWKDFRKRLKDERKVDALTLKKLQ